MYKYYLLARNFFVDNFSCKLLGYFKENYKVQHSKYLSIIPFFIISYFMKYNKYNYYFEKDNLIYLNNNKNISILPVILSIKIKGKEILDLIRKYQNNVPIWLIIYNEKIKIDPNNENIKIKLLTEEKSFKYSEVKNKTLFQILT